MDSLAPSLLNLIAATICLGLGVAVYSRNPHKSSHRGFVLVSTNLMAWALSVFWVVQCKELEQARAAVLVCEIVACFIPATFYHFVSYFPRSRFEGSRALLGVFYVLAASFALSAPSSFYIREVEVFADAPPKVSYGPLYFAYVAMALSSFSAMLLNLARKLRASQGLERRQLQYVFFGVGLMGVTIFLMIAATLMWAPLLVQAYGPVSIVVLMSFFAYAMMRYHLLDVRGLLARTLVLGTMVAFVLSSVTLITYALQRAILGDAAFIDFIPSIVAAILVIILFQSVRERIEYFVEVTILKQRYDINRLYARVAEQAAEQLQLDLLLKNVAEDLRKTIGVRKVRVLLTDDQDSSVLVSAYSTIENDPVQKTSQLSDLVRYLRGHRRPVVLERLIQRSPSEIERQIAHTMAELDAHICVPLYTSSGLVGLLLLGQKDSHEIYSAEEYTAFRALAGPLGTAIANARLYREVDALNIHLSNLFRQMREGVVAVDIQGRVTTRNEAARKTLGAIRIGQSMDDLPEEVRGLLGKTLDDQRPVLDFETSIKNDSGEPIPVIMSSSCLNAHDGTVSGAVALIYDISQVKRLEQNVMRADRLSSVGTLAAGMAHEIKNPLVSIKTFAQLLRRRFDDSDFRDTFNEVIPHEVDRIDNIVSRLLDFARPRPAEFGPRNVRAVVEGVMALVENDARKGQITVTMNFPELDLYVQGDEQQLHQVFLNLVLNALEAMDVEAGGNLTISAERTHRFLRRRGIPSADDTDCALITVSDSGCGIPVEQQDQLFTPFFTTKSEGCGLGLAVVHGIVTEHGGEIHITSRPGDGTTISLALPLVSESDAAEARAGIAEVKQS